MIGVAAMRWVFLPALAIVASPAAAWTKMDTADTCGFVTTFEGTGGTTVVVAQKMKQLAENRIIFMITNDNWSIESGDVLPETMAIEYDGDGRGFSGKPTPVNKGFAFQVTFEMLEEIENSHAQSVVVKKGGVVIDRLDFSGFWMAFLGFRVCRNPWIAEAEKRQRIESLDRELPKDPFADPAP